MLMENKQSKKKKKKKKNRDPTRDPENRPDFPVRVGFQTNKPDSVGSGFGSQ